MGRDVSPNFKDPLVSCPCGCGAEGRLRVKPWRDGSNCNRNCKGCAHCKGLRSRRRGARGQAKASNLLGIPASSLRPGHEEFARGAVLWEHKEGAQSRPVLTRYHLSREQAEAARAVGDHRPFVATFGYDGTTVAVFDLKAGPEVVAALAEMYGMTP